MRNRKKTSFTQAFIRLSFICLIISGCSNGDKEPDDELYSTETITENNEYNPNVYGIIGEEVEIYKGPGKNFDKLINEKASEALKRTHYAIVDYTCKVLEEETRDGWSRIVVVEPIWLKESHRGWIESKYIQRSKDGNITFKRKNNMFNDVKNIQTKLNSIGIGEFRSWRNDGLSWSSSTPYYSFGAASSNNGLENNLAYYLESQDESFIESIKLVLNINNAAEKSEAISLFNKTSKNTFLKLQLSVPDGLSNAILTGETFTYENDDYSVAVEHVSSNIDTWKLTIIAK